MPEKMRPASKSRLPDPADSYERAHPEHESGQGRLDNNMGSTPTSCPDKMASAITNAQDGSRQINGHDTAIPPQPDHSMMDEEPMGWDQSPQDISDPKAKRHPRTGGKGGTPDVGDRNS